MSSMPAQKYLALTVAFRENSSRIFLTTGSWTASRDFMIVPEEVMSILYPRPSARSWNDFYVAGQYTAYIGESGDIRVDVRVESRDGVEALVQGSSRQPVQRRRCL